jgi:putative ABC transport system permease protein
MRAIVVNKSGIMKPPPNPTTGVPNLKYRSGFGGGGMISPIGNSAGSSFSSITPVLTPELILMALAFGMVVSVVFGLYPAWRASQLKPVDALRYE